LEAEIGRQSSFAWRSIHCSYDLLKEGLIWGVGNGKLVWIWKDRWVPNPSTFKIISPPTLLNLDAKVCDLVDTNSKWWNFPLLEFLFSSDGVEKIKEIPFSSTNQEDMLIWKGTKNGVFSVKSAYHMLKEVEGWKIATGSSTRGSDRTKFSTHNRMNRGSYSVCQVRVRIHRDKRFVRKLILYLDESYFNLVPSLVV
jgi:hypothetical protein